MATCCFWICCVATLPVIVVLAFFLSTNNVAPAENVPLVIYSDDEILLSHDGAWMASLETEGNTSATVYQFVGTAPVFASTEKVFSFDDPNLRVGNNRNESFRFYLYGGSSLSAVWDYGLLGDVTVTLLKGEQEFNAFLAGGDYSPEMESSNTRDELYFSVTGTDSYYTVIWSSALLSSPGSFSLVVNAQTYNKNGSVALCSGLCFFELDHREANYFLFVGPPRGADIQVSQKYEVVTSETPYTGKVVLLATLLAFFSLALVVSTVWYCHRHREVLADAKARVMGYSASS